MARIRIELDVPDEMISENTGDLTNEAWREIFDAVQSLGDNIDIEEV
jgi:hypothetical protein